MHDARTFDQLRLKYRVLVRGEMRRRVPGLKEEDLQDLEQSVWIAINSSLPTFRGQSLFSTWLVGTTKNILFSWLRQQRSHPATVSPSDPSEAPTTPLPDKDGALEAPIVQAVVLETAIDHLKEKERQVIHFRYWEQLTDEEMAQRMNLPLGTVKGIVRSALRKLRHNRHLWQAFMEGMPI